MPLIKSISGIRGTIGGTSGENLTPSDILKFTGAYLAFIKKNYPNIKVKIVIGRDARVSGEMVRNLVVGALTSAGADVVDLGLATTPTVEMMVVSQKAQGGIIITASHNPAGWNALKLLNAQGEFLSAADGKEVLALAEEVTADSVREEKLGSVSFYEDAAENHIKAVLAAPLVEAAIIKKANFKIVVDGINSVGGIVMPHLLKELGVKPENIITINCEPNGRFAHKPEPLAENLAQIMAEVKKQKADLGIVVDPDVDRLAFIDENGEMFGEEYTLVAVADYVLKNFAILDQAEPGKYKPAAVSNLSSSRALRDVAVRHGGEYAAAAVGEVNVVAQMRGIKAVIGGEGNGGVIYPPLHFGRDAFIGVALVLTALAKSGQKMSECRKELPEYFMVKDRVELSAGIDLPALLGKIKAAYASEKIADIDGVKIDWPDSWVHLRASNTEPIIRIYAEAGSEAAARQRVEEVRRLIA